MENKLKNKERRCKIGRKKKVKCRKGPAFGGILKKLAFGREHNQSNLSITKHRDFVGFLEKSRSPFGKGDLLACFVLDPFELNPTPSHLSSMKETLESESESESESGISPEETEGTMRCRVLIGGKDEVRCVVEMELKRSEVSPYEDVGPMDKEQPEWGFLCSLCGTQPSLLIG
ncbi:hypothetical protein V8G54_021346 [Vigna mungo]|uniref:Uncharacterized protein n=1 Tax=Vigna mungo TaxID=3915 RepID=A0AAQ3NDW4_VIGMU